MSERELINGWWAIAALVGLGVGEAQRPAAVGERPIHKIGATSRRQPSRERTPRGCARRFVAVLDRLYESPDLRQKPDDDGL
jgi:hypothetical protein